MDLLIHIDIKLPLLDDKELKRVIEETLDRYFGSEEFAVDFHRSLPTGEARHALAAARSDIPGRFAALERWVYLLPLQVQQELNQMVNNYSQALADAKRKIREPWRR